MKLYNKHKSPKYINITPEECLSFQLEKNCHICEEELGEDRVRNHCHLTGYYSGAAHSNCNLNYKIPKLYMVFIHNLSGYNAHLFIKNLGNKTITCIPQTEEKYISFSKELLINEYIIKEGKNKKVTREIRFLGSYKFMSSSLAKLIANLDRDDCKHLKKYYIPKTN